MANEINKLALFTLGRRIEERDIKTIVSSAQEANVFAMIDAIFDFKTGLAEQLLQRLLQRGAAPAYVLTMLSRQARMLVRAKELRNQGRSEIEVQNRLGLISEFALRRTLEQADRYWKISFCSISEGIGPGRCRSGRRTSRGCAKRKKIGRDQI
jgi:DNA polymerase-3 subunit delta